MDQGWLLLWVAVDGWDGWWVVVAGLWLQSVAVGCCGGCVVGCGGGGREGWKIGRDWRCQI